MGIYSLCYSILSLGPSIICHLCAEKEEGTKSQFDLNKKKHYMLIFKQNEALLNTHTHTTYVWDNHFSDIIYKSTTMGSIRSYVKILCFTDTF